MSTEAQPIVLVIDDDAPLREALSSLFRSVGLQVKEFMPDRMKADARLSQNVADGWIKPENLKVLFTLQNLFGTPAQNRRVEATLSLQPYFPSFRNYPDYKFFDPNHAKEGYSEPLGDRTTDEKGEAEFPLGDRQAVVDDRGYFVDIRLADDERRAKLDRHENAGQ